jgi:hypothetical protein
MRNGPDQRVLSHTTPHHTHRGCVQHWWHVRLAINMHPLACSVIATAHSSMVGDALPASLSASLMVYTAFTASVYDGRSPEPGAYPDLPFSCLKLRSAKFTRVASEHGRATQFWRPWPIGEEPSDDDFIGAIWRVLRRRISRKAAKLKNGENSGNSGPASILPNQVLVAPSWNFCLPHLSCTAPTTAHHHNIQSTANLTIFVAVTCELPIPASSFIPLVNSDLG